MSKLNNRGTIFQYLKETLIPTPRPGDTMVMDNLRTHHVKAVREVLETAGIGVLSLMQSAGSCP